MPGEQFFLVQSTPSSEISWLVLENILLRNYPENVLFLDYVQLVAV